MADCLPDATRRVPLEFEDGTPVRHTEKVRAQLDLVLHVGLLVSVVLLLAACGNLPIRNTSPEPQARIELKLFRGYQSISDKPWNISLTYTPQILIDEVSAEYEEISKGSIYVFTYRSLELRPKYNFIELPNDKVQRVDEDTFYFSIPRETLAGEPGSYILSGISISKGESLLSAKVIPLINPNPGSYRKPPAPCVYGAPQSPLHPDSPILRARYVGGILSFQELDLPSDTFASADCETVSINPLLEYLPWDKKLGLLSEWHIDGSLRNTRQQHPSDGIELYRVDPKRIRQSAVWSSFIKQYSEVRAWYSMQNGKLLKAEICADDNGGDRLGDISFCPDARGEYYFHNGRQFSVVKRQNLGGSSKADWRMEYTKFIEGVPVRYWLQQYVGPVWNKAEMINPARNGVPPNAQTLTQLLQEEAFWISIAKDVGNTRIR